MSSSAHAAVAPRPASPPGFAQACFADLELSPDLARCVKHEMMTEVQERTWGPVLAGQDV